MGVGAGGSGGGSASLIAAAFALGASLSANVWQAVGPVAGVVEPPDECSCVLVTARLAIRIEWLISITVFVLGFAGVVGGCCALRRSRVVSPPAAAAPVLSTPAAPRPAPPVEAAPLAETVLSLSPEALDAYRPTRRGK